MSQVLLEQLSGFSAAGGRARPLAVRIACGAS
jgi:hypothetical protein